VVVDAHVDVHDYEQVLFYAGANVDPARDVVVARGPLDHLDHAPERQFVGGKLGIDATSKWVEEGARPWPPEIEMSPEIRDLVDRRWAEYGLEESVPGARNGSVRKTERSLRQLLRR
jgi:4-hydroxy-3-polyprenylbenzoate decarboxylase